MNELASAPIARASYILAKEFGWTLDEINDLTIGQISMLLFMIAGDRRSVE